MKDTSKLLNQLRLERDDPAPSVAASSGLLYGSVTVVILAGLVASFLWAGAQDESVLIEVATVTSVADSGNEDNAVLNASGYIVARRQATVSAKITARVVEVFIDEGQSVEANAVIAMLDDSNIRAALARDDAQLQQARASLNAAEVALANDSTLFDRSAQQLERGVGSQQDFDTAKARHDAAEAALDVARQVVAVAAATRDITQRNLDDTLVRAPFAGIVTVKAVQPGEMVSPVSAGGGFTRTGIGTIVDMASLEVDVDVSESFINRINDGQPVTVRLNAYPDWAIAGRVITVVPTADRAKATVKVRIALEEHDSRILPDMGARVTFLRSAAGAIEKQAPISGVVVPDKALLVDGTRGTVFVVADGIVQQREVELGTQMAAGWLVPQGLSAGTSVAASALEKLYDGATVRVAQEP